MLSQQYLRALGVAKQTQVGMMLRRGHAVTAEERALLDMPPMDVVSRYIQRARQNGTSLGEAMSAYYDPPPATSIDLDATDATDAAAGAGAEAGAGASQQRRPERTAVTYLDLQYEGAKRRTKMASTEQIQAALTRIVADGVHVAIFISPTRPSPEAKREIVEAGSTGGGGSRAAHASNVRIQFLMLSQLQTTVVDHVDVPRHTVLSAAHAATVLRELNCQPHQLPVLPASDVVAQYYDYREGEIVRIDRPSGVAYRVVVDA